MIAQRTMLRSALRATVASAPRASSRTVSYCAASRAPASLLSSRPRLLPAEKLRTSSYSIRWYSESAAASKFYSFEEIQDLASQESSSVTIVDTREPGELQQTGRIPNSINIPITSAPDSFHITAEEFEDRFGFARPEKDADVVFYCKAGVRSRAAAGIAKEAGWTKVGEYPGSWLDWSGKGGKIQH